MNQEDTNDPLADIRERIASGRTRARKRALARLRRLGDEPGAVALLVEVLEGSDQELRPTAARLLGTLKSRDAIPALMAVLSAVDAEGNEDVAPQAAWALGRIGDEQAIPALQSLLENRHDDDFLFFAHREALYALAALGVKAPIERFIADESRPDDLRVEALEDIVPLARSDGDLLRP